MSPSHRFIALLLVFVLAGAVASCGHSVTFYVDRGNEEFAKGAFDDAVLNYRKAIQRNPRFGEAHYRLGRCLAKKGQFAEAYQELLTAEQLLPAREDVRVELGNLTLSLYLASADHPQALYDQLARISKQLLAQNSKSVDALRYQGELALTDRRYRDAISLLQQANTLRPWDPGVAGPLVEALLKDGQYAEGEKNAWQLIEARKDFSLIYEVLYAHYMARNRYDDGERVVQARIQNNPGNVDAVLQLAFHYEHLKEPSRTIETLQRLINDPKTYPQPHLHVGEFYATVGKPDEAIREFREGLKTEPGSGSVYLSKIAGALVAQHRTDEAAETVQMMLKDNPKNRDARAMRAILLLENGKPDKVETAIQELQDLLKQNGDDAPLHYSLGRAEMIRGRLDAAKREFQETIRIKTNDVPARLALLQISAKNQSYPDVLRYAGEVLKLDPNNPPARFWTAVARMGSGSYEQARLDLTRLLRDYPDSKDVLLQLGLLNLKEKRFKEAEAIFRRSYQGTSADARPLEGLIRTYVAQNDLDLAFQTAEADLKRSPDSKPAHALLAAVARVAGKYPAAVKQYQWLISNEPKNLSNYVELAQTYQAAGDLGYALEVFRKAQQLAPGDGRVVAAIAYLLDSTGQRNEAKATYRRALQLEPNNPQILNNLAYLLADTNDNLDEALQLVKDAQRQAPNDPGLADTLAWIYVRKQYNDGAIQILTRLLRDHPDDPGYRYHLGLACFQSGDKARAKQELETALSHQPEKDTADKIRSLIAKIG